ncbi:hypothetical protein DERF_007276 [Dermatophagoides farinae]|uniref:Uncharacterized protein n=1 Tax=Dermatophagoides farinae TaxID=6954 RepID=A0A922I1V8_DERFA|nr:hypothetical protein DERF_007276 [Dermatophagoides farinae]
MIFRFLHFPLHHHYFISFHIFVPVMLTKRLRFLIDFYLIKCTTEKIQFTYKIESFSSDTMLS